MMFKWLTNSLDTKEKQNKAYRESIRWSSTIGCMFGYVMGIMPPILNSMNHSKDPVTILGLAGFLIFGALYGCMWLPDYLSIKIIKLVHLNKVTGTSTEKSQ